MDFDLIFPKQTSTPQTPTQQQSQSQAQNTPQQQQQQPIMINYEESGDDSIVPSTPTLYVPRRADGFSEAVSSPQPHVSAAANNQLILIRFRIEMNSFFFFNI